MTAPLTTLYTFCTSCLLVTLGTWVALSRLYRVERKLVSQRARVHGNLTENAPTFLIALLLCELQGGVAGLLHVLGISFIAARLAHAWGMSRPNPVNLFRQIGIVLTWIVLGAAATYALTLTLGTGSSALPS